MEEFFEKNGNRLLYTGLAFLGLSVILIFFSELHLLAAIGIFIGFGLLILAELEFREKKKIAFKKFDEQFEDMLIEKYDFTSVRSYLCIDHPPVGIALDPEKRMLFHCSDWRKESTYELISLDEVLQVELVEGAKTTIRTSRSGQIAGALVGGAIAGEAGAVIGGLSATKRLETEVSELKLRLVMNNIHNPIKEIYFYKWISVKTDNEKYKERYNHAYEWFVILDKVLKAEQHKA